ncbi:Serine/threonine-protein kinase Nek1 [Folsomia candida]|uniref:Serine/threonine-protein kinase Nek1 n=1 Tax=Folsomia candida TaxID=158441 RepID=A0A226DZD1_FOLCA|nr:Serine/threonine-protein kinase Nek1 [Folsomia candida]
MTTSSDFVDDVIRYESFLGHGSFEFVLKAEHRYKKYSCIKFIYSTDDQTESSNPTRTTLNQTTFGTQKYCHTWLRDSETRMDSLLNMFKQMQIIDDLLSGLSLLHENRIIHRDLQPANIIFTSECSPPVKIGDFGQCRILSDNPTLTRSNIGTQTYTAPEVLRLIIWDVIALIKPGERGVIFDRLVNDGETDIVAEGNQTNCATNPVSIFKEEKVRNSDSDLSLHPEFNLQFFLSNSVKSTRNGFAQLGQPVPADDHPLGGWPQHIPSQQVRILPCRNGEELEFYLSIIPPDFAILLEEGIYQGRFKIWQSNITIVGKGVEKTLIFALDNLHIYGNNCSVSNLSILRSHSHKVGVTFLGVTLTTTETGLGPSFGCVISANGCTLSDINFLKGSSGMTIDGSNAKIDRVKFSNMDEGSCIGMTKNSSNCTITDVTCENCRYGILVCGRYHLLKRIVLKNVTVPESIFTYGLCFLEGDNNTLEDSTFIQYGPYFKWDVRIKSANATVRNCTCYTVKVSGKVEKAGGKGYLFNDGMRFFQGGKYHSKKYK